MDLSPCEDCPFDQRYINCGNKGLNQGYVSRGSGGHLFCVACIMFLSLPYGVCHRDVNGHPKSETGLGRVTAKAIQYIYRRVHSLGMFTNTITFI